MTDQLLQHVYVVNPSGGGPSPSVTPLPQQISVIDRSGTITTGGVDQTLMLANASRKYILIQNVSTGDLWFNFTIPAVLNQPSIRLSSNDSFVMESSVVSSQEVHIIGATTGQQFVAKEAS